MESTRQKKVSRLIQKEIADIFQKKGNEIAPGKLISVTVVRMSPDLSLAKIYLSIFPSEGKQRQRPFLKDKVRTGTENQDSAPDSP